MRTPRARSFSPILSLLTAALAGSMAQPAVGQDGWTLAQTGNRYGGAASTTAPAAGSDSRFGSALSSSAPAAAAPAPLGAQPTASPLANSSALSTRSPAAKQPGMTRTAAAGRSGMGARATITRWNGQLPNQHGQIGRSIDISPYTLRQPAEQRPEQVIVDWVLRETGYEAWHGEITSSLSADRNNLHVYHTKEMVGLVADLVDRFISSQAANQAFSLRIATVQNPNWRAKALALMTPIPVQSPGMQGWIMPKENAAILLSQLTKRSDWREHSASNQMVLNGHKVLLSTMRPRSYIKGVIRTGNTWPGFQPEQGQLEEGATMEFSPLLSYDQSSADAVIKIRIHQVEKMAKVKLDIPTTVTGNQRMQVEVPQMTMANVHERFRWPADHVLLLSMGVVPPPTQTAGGNRLVKMIPGVNSSPRADGLLMVEVRGTAIPSATPGAPGARTALQSGAFSGRY